MSPGNPPHTFNKSWGRKWRLRWEGFAEKKGFKLLSVEWKDWGGDGIPVIISINVSGIITVRCMFYGPACVCVLGRHPVYRWDYYTQSAVAQSSVSDEGLCQLAVCWFCLLVLCYLPSVHWCCWLGGRKGIRPVENWVVGCWRGYLSGARCRLAYMAQLMPLPLTVSCFSKIQIGLTFLVPAHPGSPGQRPVKRMYVMHVCIVVLSNGSGGPRAPSLKAPKQPIRYFSISFVSET